MYVCSTCQLIEPDLLPTDKLPAELVSEVSKYWRLTAGDLIYTGTPKGSGPIEIGQSFEGGVNGAGKFSGKVFGR